IIEKPTQENAPSNLAVVGRYILPHTIFTILNDTKKGSGNEIQLSDAIDKLLLSQKIFAHKIKGLRYDCGSKLGYIKATIAYGLKHPEIGLALKEHLEKL
ncbi:MAG TPA: UTP--glucose-1-phosphate uridylyltransferase, partial [Burkholderiales bacterium]|nr:UTP--glucose-1-phosphate uridylyltransferase [Burkholderiales bacterium]